MGWGNGMGYEGMGGRGDEGQSFQRVEWECTLQNKSKLIFNFPIYEVAG